MGNMKGQTLAGATATTLPVLNWIDHIPCSWYERSLINRYNSHDSDKLEKDYVNAACRAKIKADLQMRLLKNKQYTGPLPEMETFELDKLSKEDQVLYTTQYQKRYKPPKGRTLLEWRSFGSIPSFPYPVLSGGNDQMDEKEDQSDQSAIPHVPIAQNNLDIDITDAKRNWETDDQRHKDTKASCQDCGEKGSHCHGTIMKTDLPPILQNNDEKVHMDTKTELEKPDTDSDCHSDLDSCYCV